MFDELIKKIKADVLEPVTSLEMEIAEKAISDLGLLIVENFDGIDDAYADSEDGVSLSMSVKIIPPAHAGEPKKIESKLNFIKDRIKVGKVSFAGGDQRQLFD